MNGFARLRLEFILHNRHHTLAFELQVQVMKILVFSNPNPNEEGVFDVVTSVRKKHPSSSTIQEVGCIILGNLHLKNELDAKVATGLILALIKKHSGDNHIKLNGLWALLNICSVHY